MYAKELFKPDKPPRKVETGRDGGLYALSSTLSEQSGVIVRMLTVTEWQDIEQIRDTVSSVCTRRHLIWGYGQQP